MPKTIEPWWPPRGFEPQGQYLAMMNPEVEREASDIRTTFVQIARSGVGLPVTSPVYLNLCYPGDTPDHQKAMAASQQMCALVCAGWLRCAGCQHHLLAPPYWGRNDAFTRIEVIARDHGAWGGHDGEFAEGDLLLIGTDVPYDAHNRAKIIAQWGTPGHAMLVEKVEEDGQMVTIDGGRGPIVRTARRVTKDAQGRVWIVTAGGPTRRVWGSIRVAKLKFDPDAQWCLPKGPNYPGLES